MSARCAGASGTARVTAAEASGPRIAKASVPRRVLVVDDNVDAAALLAELCEMMGHEVKVAHDGPQALTAVESFTPDIAVLDIAGFIQPLA